MSVTSTPNPNAGEPVKRELGSFLRDAWRLAVPYFQSEQKWSARGLLLVIIVMNLSLVGMTVLLSFWNREFFNSLQNKDYDAFLALLFTYQRGESGLMPGFVGIAVVYILIAIHRTYLNQFLQIRWRTWLTRRFLGDWLSDRAYYRISLSAAQNAGTDNPDQRIAEDLREFTADTMTLGLGLLSNVVSLFSFVSILWSLSGSISVFGVSVPGYMVWVALAYAIAGTTLTHLVGSPLVGLNFRQQRVEANFRYSLVRLRENMEGVALYGGEAAEQGTLLTRFHAVIRNWRAIMIRTKYLNALIAGYEQVASVFPIVVAAPRYFAGQMQLGGLTQTAGAFSSVQDAMSWFISFYTTLASWRATVERLVTFDRAIAEARAASGQGVSVSTETTPTGAVALHDVTLALPNGDTLMRHGDLVLPPGQSVVITGRSGSGKSTLFRALAGIWPFGSGRITRPAGTALFLPQRPYIPLGTLREVAAYPLQAQGYPTEAVISALEAAGLAALVPQLDAEENWSQRLSGGEQQRLALARALLAKPDWLFLDEATASLDPEAEAELYRAIQRLLPETTLVSIAHRRSVADFHERRIEVQKGQGSAMDPLRAEPLEPIP